MGTLDSKTELYKLNFIQTFKQKQKLTMTYYNKWNAKEKNEMIPSHQQSMPQSPEIEEHVIEQLNSSLVLMGKKKKKKKKKGFTDSFLQFFKLNWIGFLFIFLSWESKIQYRIIKK